MAIQMERDASSISVLTPKRHGSPHVGLSLSSAVEIRGAPVRQAVSILVNGFSPAKLAKVFDGYFSQPMVLNNFKKQPDSIMIRAAWNVISIWLSARRCPQFSESLRLDEAENWFVGVNRKEFPRLTAQATSKSVSEAEQLLNKIHFDDEFRDLLPYIFEEHGPVCRRAAMKDPSAITARTVKRESGIFYTPADVADFMVEHIKRTYVGDFLTAKVLDPACGTGVFLLAMLRAVSKLDQMPFSRFNYVSSCLHGIDISSQALDTAAFLLLGECLDEIKTIALSPHAAWNAIRKNLVVSDSLYIEPPNFKSDHGTPRLFRSTTPSLKDLFPRVENAFDILIGNPPYATLDEHFDFDSLASRFVSLSSVSSSLRVNLYPLFIELMWQFTKPGCNAAALVTPLSIAFHGGAQYRNCRHAMGRNGGRWQFAFFDREPHALFGEEVKTRNAILFRVETPNTVQREQPSQIETGSLRKWTSRTRPRLFQSIDFTPLDSADITHGIPKLNGIIQARTFLLLRNRLNRFSTFAVRIGTCKHTDVFTSQDTPLVLVGGTAYNFINVFRPFKLSPDDQGLPPSESPVHCLEFETETEANAAFAILSSRLVFWIWRILGDGFHVSSQLFESIPVERMSFTQTEFQSLVEMGKQLWRKLQKYRFVSVNRGRQTFGFRSLSCQEELNTIDAILVRAVGCDSDFARELQQFVIENAVVDATDERRDHVLRHFNESPK